jgi:ribonuclease VapC
MVETSALVAILLEEPEWERLAEQIDGESASTTCVAVFEASLSLAKHTRLSPTQAHRIVVDLAERLRIEVKPVVPPMIALAAEARERYGAGRHGLNMGDCLSYGAARYFRTRLLFKGDDFARTDVNDGFASGASGTT